MKTALLLTFVPVPKSCPGKLKGKVFPKGPCLEVTSALGPGLPVTTFLLNKLSLKNLGKLVLWLIINAREKDL